MSRFLPEHYRALRERAALVDRSHRGKLRLTGADRRTYLQGLLTNDIVALAPGGGCYAALLTPQGRMIADMRVLETGEAILLEMSEAVASAVLDRLEGFVFSEDVQVSDVTSSQVQFGIFGPSASSVVLGALSESDAASGGTLSEGRLASMRQYDNLWLEFGGGPVLIVRSDEVGIEGFEVFADAASGEGLRAALGSAGAEAVADTAVEVCRIEAGRPAFGQDMGEDTIPLEAGIEDRAISQTKGCYVGQEIIIRVLHRGHGRVARRLVGLTLEANAPVPAPGDSVNAGERRVGAVTSAAHSPALDRAIALGYVHRDFTAPGTAVTVGAGDGSPAQVSALPFVPQPEPLPVR